MQLRWHNYKYFPYERDLARREVQSLLEPKEICEHHSSVEVEGATRIDYLDRLVYFVSASVDSASSIFTKQGLLERVNGNGTNRQSTRYSAHGLHEYKGKFNPQVAKVLLNIFNAVPGTIVLDPFCGSGTSLVECAHLGIRCVGTDINPLAVFLANAKLKSLEIPSEQILSDGQRAVSAVRNSKTKIIRGGKVGEYLRSWFPWENLRQIEGLRLAIKDSVTDSEPVLLAIASNLLREYSLQEPHDLRIRRRKSPMPDKPFLDMYGQAVRTFCARLGDAQQILGVRTAQAKAVLGDCTRPTEFSGICGDMFDAVLTSPPYATALPYIDTQRLSLVWLGLLHPAEILALDAELIGSREIRGKNKTAMLMALENNREELPEEQAKCCLRLQNTLGEGDGFRRQAVPRLLYRYFSGMADAFRSVRNTVVSNAPFGLIVGSNHTVLGGVRYDIDTPSHLASIASERGWAHIETVPLQTYRRYGLHASNATTKESLVILRAN